MEFPVLVPVGPWRLHPHVVFELLAYSLGMQMFLFLRRREGDVLARGQRPAVILCAIVGAVVGAKALAWLVDPAALWERRDDWQAWLEGKTIVGGLLGGLVGVELGKKALGIRDSTGDLFAVPLALGIAIGRVGCFLTGLADRTYGDPTRMPWGVDFGDGIPRHPTQLYEMVALGALMALLAWQRSKGFAPGDQFRLFMVGYLAWRLMVGFIQPEPTLAGLSAIQWAALAGVSYYARHVPRIARALVSRPVPTSPSPLP